MDAGKREPEDVMGAKKGGHASIVGCMVGGERRTKDCRDNGCQGKGQEVRWVLQKKKEQVLREGGLQVGNGGRHYECC